MYILTRTGIPAYVPFLARLLQASSSPFLIALLVTALLTTNTVNAAEPVWVLVNTNEAVIKVMQGDKVIVEYDNVSIGQRGTAELHLRGDETTPLGEFRIIAIDHKSRFQWFFGLDYPTLKHTKLALKQQKISTEDYLRLMKAHLKKVAPPLDTALGGAIGIHGIGRGSLSVHNQYNWTDGCVALNNEQIEDFAAWVEVGTRVLIE